MTRSARGLPANWNGRALTEWLEALTGPSPKQEPRLRLGVYPAPPLSTRAEIGRARVDLPLRVSHRDLLEREGPLGRAWRSPADPSAVGSAFG